MKKILLALMAFFVMLSANAETFFVETNLTIENFWPKVGKEVEKVQLVARKLIHDNDLKRSPIFVERTWKSVYAHTTNYTKSIVISLGMLQYISNDDELAYVLAHELAHAQECYDGMLKLVAMSFNSKKYEYKADAKAVDYLVKSGYNPVAAILMADKIFDEPLWDWGFTYTHPKGSKRMMAMYEYIYKKYPQYLNTPMAKTPAFQDFVKQNEREVAVFQQKQAKKKKKMQNL